MKIDEKVIRRLVYDTPNAITNVLRNPNPIPSPNPQYEWKPPGWVRVVKANLIPFIRIVQLMKRPMSDRPTKYERLLGSVCWAWDDGDMYTEVFARMPAGGDRVVWQLYEASEIDPDQGPGHERFVDLTREQARKLLVAWGAI
jgi:hypothetical protein